VTHVRPAHVGAIAPRNAPASARRHTSFARVVGAIGLVLLTSLLFWMLTDDAFRVTDASVHFEGLVHAEESAVRDLLADIERGPNIFRVRTSDIVAELSTLTEVDAASARVTLPADLTVLLDERDPVFIWSNGALSWLVDEEGMLFAPADEATAASVRAAVTGAHADDVAATDEDGTIPAEPESTAVALDPALEARAALPLVEDGRLPPEPPTVGTYLPESDLAVMRQLLAVTPELLGSQAQDLRLRVDQADGYVLVSEDRGWRALFGYYTPTLQPPDVIPRQVQCLRWLLASEERKLETVRLAISDTTCGTFTKYK
jgi:hypothetical protein